MPSYHHPLNENDSVDDSSSSVKNKAFSSTTTNNKGTATGSADQAARATAELAGRGVTRPGELLRFNAPAVIVAWCEWWDERPNVGPGLLAQMIRSGEEPPRRRRALDEQRVTSWLRANFPELCEPDPHPAAVAAVVRLHYKHGKNGFTKREHGPTIRSAVADWCRRFPDPIVRNEESC